MYVQAKTWKTRPSELLGIDDPYLAYCVDEAISDFGNYVSEELNKVKGKDEKAIAGKQELVLKGLLGDDPKARYAQPVATDK